jgi:hypothetical protein
MSICTGEKERQEEERKETSNRERERERIRKQESCETSTSNETIVRATGKEDERKVWRIGGMVTDGGKLKYPERNLPLYLFIHHKSHIHCHSTEPDTAGSGN